MRVNYNKCMLGNPPLHILVALSCSIVSCPDISRCRSWRDANHMISSAPRWSSICMLCDGWPPTLHSSSTGCLRCLFVTDAFYLLYKVAPTCEQVSYIYFCKGSVIKGSVINIPKVILNIKLHLSSCFPFDVQVSYKDFVLVIRHIMPIVIEVYASKKGRKLYLSPFILF